MPKALAADPAAARSLGRTVTLVMALACGIGVANVYFYFPQAITPLIASGLGVRPDTAALVSTAAQLGYGAGIFLIPMAAGLVDARRRGAVVGVLQGGLIGGILLARAFGGLLGQWLGWRAPYLIAAVLVGVLAVALPATEPPTRTRYPALLAAATRLLRGEPALRRSCWYQGMLFAGLSAAWTCLALLLHGPAYHLGANAVGLIALVGAASVLGAPAAGRWVDRRGPDVVNLCCILAALGAAAILLAGAHGGSIGLIALCAGLLLLDVAVQCGQLANQSRIFALDQTARSCLNTAYMTTVFLAGSLGSWLGVRLFTWLGWSGVCALLAVAAAAALAWHLLRPGEHTTTSSDERIVR